MINITLQSLLAKAKDITDDSRLVAPGSVFFAMQGLRRHGLAGLEEALERGAIAIAHDGQIDEADRARLNQLSIPVIEQVDLKTALPEILKSFWKNPQAELRLHAVTGTNGKSSIAWLLAKLLNGAMLGTIGVGRPGEHHKSSLTTPSLFSTYRHLAEFRHQGIRDVVLEASSHALVQGRLLGLSFETAIFTNLGHDHLDYHGDRDAYGAAKAKLFRDFKAKQQLFNLDDAFGQTLFNEQQKRAHDRDTQILGYSINGHPSASIWISDVDVRADHGDWGMGGQAHLMDGETITIRSALLGRVNAYNLLVCAAVAQSMGMEVQELTKQLATLTPPPGRMEIIQPGSAMKNEHKPVVVVDYAHSPDALKEALMMLRPMCRAQLWCVFGCGGDRDPSKRAPMGRIAESVADRVMLTDDNPRHESSLAIVRAIQSGMRQPERARVILDRVQAIETAIESAGADDVILIAGKGHETEQLVGDRRWPLDDRAIAKAALDRRMNPSQEAC